MAEEEETKASSSSSFSIMSRKRKSSEENESSGSKSCSLDDDHDHLKSSKEKKKKIANWKLACYLANEYMTNGTLLGKRIIDQQQHQDCRNANRPVVLEVPLPDNNEEIRKQPQKKETQGKDKSSMSIGFLGLGIMGSPMAHNLVKAGCDVTVWNRTSSKCDSLLNIGAKYGSSPESVASACDVTFSMLADPGSAMEVACGKQGAVHGLGPGKGYVDVSTVDGQTSKAISIAVKATGAQFLEAPVSGSKKPAEEGKLIFLTAGDKSLYHEVAPILDIMGKSRFYLGDVGNGAAMKLVVNMIMGSMMASFSEGMILGQKIGLDPGVLVEVISQGAISAPMYSMKGPSMIKGSYAPAFPLKHQQKDLRLALAMAEEVSQPIPVAAATNELYKVAKAHGLGEEDFSAVIEALKAEL